MTGAWFGEPWPSTGARAPVCEDDTRHVPTPVGQACGLCKEAVTDGDRGTFFLTGEPCHAECGLRNVLGGAGHLASEPHGVGRCDPDGGLSPRRSALLVWEWVERMGVENLIGAARFPRVREHMQAELDTWRSSREGRMTDMGRNWRDKDDLDLTTEDVSAMLEEGTAVGTRGPAPAPDHRHDFGPDQDQPCPCGYPAPPF